jgi:integrase
MATIETRGEGKNARYRVKVRIKGEKPRTRTFKRLTDANAWAKAVETDFGRGAFVPTTVDRRRTLADLIDKFVAEELPVRKHNADRMLSSNLKWWKENAGYVTLDKLTASTIAGLKSELRARKTRAGTPLAPATINRYLAALSAVCKWAWKELHWLPSNPVLSVTKGAEHAGIVRYLSDDERKALFKACREINDPNIATAVALALATGARYGNIRNLTWADVDLEQWRLRFSHTKNDQPRYVPLVGPAQAILKAHYDRDPTQEGWVFKGARDDAPADLDRPWREVRAAAGLVGEKHCRFHDLRHTTASYLTMNGASLAEVAEALGHRTLTMAKRYSHQSGEHVRSTFERISGRLGEE